MSTSASLETAHLHGQQSTARIDKTLPSAAFSRAVEAEKVLLQSLNTNDIVTTVFDVPVRHGMTIHTLVAEPIGNTAAADKEPILLVHGFVGALGFWRHLIPRLTKEGHTVYCIDLLGWGLSSRPHISAAPSSSAAYDFPNYEWTQHFRQHSQKKTVEDVATFWVESLADWREHMDLTQFHIIGHSMGGWVSGEFALRYPQHINKLTLLCSVGVYQNDRTWFTGSAGAFMEVTRAIFGVNWPFAFVRALDSLTFHKLTFRSMTGTYAQKNADADAMLEYIRAYMALPSSGETVAEYIRRRGKDSEEDGHVLWNRLPKATFPVSLVYGETDVIVPNYDDKVLDQLANAPQVDVNVIGMGAGHGAPVTSEEKLLDAVAAVLLGPEATDRYKAENPGKIDFSYRREGTAAAQERVISPRL